MASRLLKAGALIATLLLTAACNEKSVSSGMASRGQPHISSKTLAEMKKQNMPMGSPVVARVFKEEAKVEVWKQKSNGRYGLLATYDICKYSGQLGPKFTEGDRQAPEGFYTVRPGQMNPNSKYHLSFDIGYPNAFDRAHGRTGANLMVHGACSSSGCYSMTDGQIEEIYAVARESFKGGQQEFQIQAYPFRMTAANMARYRKDTNFPFWKNLKEGYDAFEVTRVPPKVDVCEKRYAFNLNAPLGTTISPSGPCPGSTDAMGVAYQSYKQKYDADFAAAVGKGPEPKDSINGIEEANLVKDWTKRRARGERISMDPPSLDANGNMVVTSRMGRANNEAGRKLAATEAEDAAKKQEAAALAAAKQRAEEEKAAQIAEAKQRKEDAKALAEANAQAPSAEPQVESTAAIAPSTDAPAAEQVAPAEAVASAPPAESDGVVGNVRKRLGKLFGG